MRLRTIPDYELAASEKMPTQLFDVLYGRYGAPGWETNTANIDGFARLTFRPKVLTGASAPRKLNTTVLGQQIELPIMVAPSGSHQRSHADGELATARAAASVGTVMTLATKATFSIEEVAEVGSGPLWFQLYPMRDRKLTEALIRRAEDAGYRAIVLTADNLCIATYPGGSHITFSSPELRAPTLDPARLNKNFTTMPFAHDVVTEDDFVAMRDDTLSWDHLGWLRSLSRLPLVIKGVQTAEDARRCAELGVDAISVSNHGGTVFRFARAAVDALGEVAAAVAGSATEVYLDGGVRNGGDVLKALALGARAVLVARPVQWGLVVDGQAGVEDVFAILRRELDWSLGMCGLADVEDVPRSIVG
jgi:4-hydroxymandelate oxidase